MWQPMDSQMTLCRETSSCEKRNKERDDGHVMYY